MEKVRPWCGQPSDRGRLRNRTGTGTGVYVHSVEDSTLMSIFDQFRFSFVSGVAKNRP